MRVLSRAAIESFIKNHADATVGLDAWYDTIRSRDFANLMELKELFGNKVDVVVKGYVFNIGSNKYRLAASIHFDKSRVFIREIMTHAEYSKEHWKKRHQDFH